MKELKCSRCHKKEFVEESYRYHECHRCHDRTERRYPTIREYKPKDFNIETLYSFPSFEQSLANDERIYGKRIGKVAREKLWKEYQLKRADYDRDAPKRNAYVNAVYAHDRFPLRVQECKNVRDKARKLANGDDSVDKFSIIDHCGNCPSCNDFFNSLRNGTLALEPTSDPELEAELRKEGYCSLKEWNKWMNEFPNGA